MARTKGLVVVAVVAGIVGAASLSFRAAQTRDHLLSESTSPDGSWSVHLYWRNTSAMPASYNVKLDLVVRMRHNPDVVLRRELAEAEMITDIDQDFTPVVCENDRALIGELVLPKTDALPVNSYGHPPHWRANER